MTYTNTQTELTIEGVEEPSVINYFATINQENFEQTAALFSEDGQMLAPFEKPIVGRDAIALYLEKEAKGMKLLPHRYEPSEAEEQIRVTGKVKTSLFSVNVAWYFSLNQQQITLVRIKLLASPQELLGLKNTKEADI